MNKEQKKISTDTEEKVANLKREKVCWTLQYPRTKEKCEKYKRGNGRRKVRKRPLDSIV